MLRIAALATALALFACNKKEPEMSAKSPPPATAAPTGAAATADGVRKVPVEVREQGYAPDRIPGKPGEKLSLVFTRKVDGACYEQLKTPDGKVIDLPKDKPVEVAVTVPQQGELKFACGMDMLSGVIVAEKG